MSYPELDWKANADSYVQSLSEPFKSAVRDAFLIGWMGRGVADERAVFERQKALLIDDSIPKEDVLLKNATMDDACAAIKGNEFPKSELSISAP